MQDNHEGLKENQLGYYAQTLRKLQVSTHEI